MVWLAAVVLMCILPSCGEREEAEGGSGTYVSREAEEVSAKYLGDGGDAGGSSGEMSGQAAAVPGSSDGVAGEQISDITEELEVHFLDVGQGDCTLICCGNENMLIDAGNNEQGTKIQSYLEKQGVDRLKYVVCTHPDEDHIGGMDAILYKYDCDTILMEDSPKDTDTYRDVEEAMKARGYRRTLPAVGQRYTLGDAVFTIVGPESQGEGDNNDSIALVLVHGENRFLFTGDAEEEEETEMLESGISLDVDLYKAGHHGSRTSSCEKLLEAASPVYAVISCGEGNSYGHPHAEILNRFRALGVKVFRTDEQGSLIVNSDGSGLAWNCSPSETWQAGEPTGSGGLPEEEDPAEGALPEEEGYICNTNTMKFHRPGCASVEQMKEKNKLSTDASREELIGQGYEPCKKCKP